MADSPGNAYTTTAQIVEKFIPAPNLPYRPRLPKSYRPKLGLIGCGGITEFHLKAYQRAGFEVVAFQDIAEDRAAARRDEFYPQGRVYKTHQELLADGEVEVVDIATHPKERVKLVEDALRARKHVLSQKPFVYDLAEGEKLVALADEMGVKLAVNQNGRWSPHFSYMHNAVHSGLIGDVMSVRTNVHWDHTWTFGTPFEEIRDLILYDFAIHWFDFVSSVLGERQVLGVQAFRSRAPGQTGKPPMLAEAILHLEDGQASLVFDAYVKHGALDLTFIAGTKGTIVSQGPDHSSQTMRIYTADGIMEPDLAGCWFEDGFLGTMAELLCAIEENREPLNSARDNLKSVALSFAAVASASENRPVRPGDVRRLPSGSVPGI